ncbi:YlxR family protein [Gordonia sp. (in: high G+C Gram-positive bacteria)]|uniref:YlxR family protein n=1 Tax=Gordonia sp. (in: high G+C Gram-positive bacteria) TaxID=84139 RepID=UPI0039E38753
MTVHDDPERQQPALIVDHRKNLPGRGAWLHPNEDCVSSAVRRKAFGPALRTPGLTVRPEDLAEITAGSAEMAPWGAGEGE